MHNNYIHHGQWYRENDASDMKSTCIKYKNYYVLGQMIDGTQIEGIIETVDEDGVIMFVPEEIEEADNRFGYNGYEGYDGYGGNRRRYRRYRRRRFPYFQFVFPFFIPYPFYY